MQSPLLTRNSSSFGPGQRNDRQGRIQIRSDERDIPPTPPLRQQQAFQTMPLSINKPRQAQKTVASVLADSIASTWSSSSSDSEPTPTASSIAAMRERNAQLATQLLPVQLTLPSTFSSSVTLAPAQNIASTIKGARFGTPNSQEPRDIPKAAMSSEEVASIKASAAPFTPTKSSNLSAPPIRSDSNDTSYSGETVVLPDGTPVPTVRTDFQNLKKISVPRPVEDNNASAVPFVGGHVLSRTDPKIVAKQDGSSRTICSPTPQTIAAAERQSSLQVPQVSGQSAASGEQRIPSPLSASAQTPRTPHIPQSLKFQKSAPSLGSTSAHELQQPIQAQPVTQEQGNKSISGIAQAKSDDTDVRKRDNAETIGFRDDPRRNTFGELAPSMLEEANRKLFLYQMQQLDEDASEKGVYSSRQPAVAPVLAAAKETSAEAEQRVESIATTKTAPIARRESSTSQRSRRDSIGSATTAFDSPTKEDFPSNLFSPNNRSGNANPTRTTARATVAPPSDVLEVQEPDEVELIQSPSEDEEGTPKKVTIYLSTSASPSSSIHTRTTTMKTPTLEHCELAERSQICASSQSPLSKLVRLVVLVLVILAYRFVATLPTSKSTVLGRDSTVQRRLADSASGPVSIAR